MAAIFSLRNWVAKQLMREAQGIMKIPNKGQIDFGEMMIRENLFKRGIDVRSVTNEKQLQSILNTPIPTPPTPKSADVLDFTGKKIDTNKPISGGKNIDIADDKVVDQMYRTSGPRSLDEDKTYLAEFIAEDAGKVLDDLPIAEQNKFIKRAENALRRNVKQYQGKKAETELDEPLIDWEAVEKTDIEDFAQGGRTGLSYLLAEDTNERMPFSKGKGVDLLRRGFLKTMGVAGAGIAALKTGILGFGKGASKQVAKGLTSVPIKNVDGMPAWFEPLVNKVIKEGDDVTKKWATQERQIVHKTKLPDSQTDVLVTQDLNTGDVVVDIGLEKHGFADGKFGQPVRLEYKASEKIEPVINSWTGKVHTKGKKTPEEFNVEEAEFTGGHPENIKFEESTIEKFGDHASNFDEVEMFATDKVKKSKPTKKAQQLEWEQGKAEADADRWADEN